MLADSGAALVVGSAGAVEGLVDPPPLLELESISSTGSGDEVNAVVRPDDAAYIMYTSGSTGAPKGVVVEHAGACNLVLAEQELFARGAGTRVLQVSSPGFDAWISEVFLALLAGGELHLPRPGAVLAGGSLASLLRDRAINTLVIAPSVLATVDDADLPELDTIVVGGEPCPAPIVQRWAGGRRVLNTYGPTETTVEATVARCHPSASPPPIGRPMPNVLVHLLDGLGRPVPPGAVGEVYIGGAGVARGYLGLAGLTAERFLPDPFAGERGARMYRTGDLARVLADGQLAFVGRVDQQLQVRGCRVEPAEIEAALVEHPAVYQAVVVGYGEPDGTGTELVAYVAVSGERPAPADLRRHAAARLPGFMVPSRYVVLPQLPTTANGKVDRGALPRPARDDVASRVVRRPLTAVEETLVAIWAGVLGVDGIDSRSDFFALGGHSLLALQIASEIEQTFAIAFPPGLLFDAPVLERCAELIEELKQAAAPGRPELRARGAVPRRPASHQECDLARASAGMSLYTMPFAYRLRGPLDVAALQRAVEGVAGRHEVLRAGFDVIGPEVLVTAERSGGVEWRSGDLSDAGAGAWPAALAQIAAEAGRPFDLRRGPLVRARLARLAADDHLLTLVFHHIVVDGWSIRIICDEIALGYAGHEPPPPALRYSDYAAWQQELVAGPAAAAQLEHWRGRLGAGEAARYDWERPGVDSLLASRRPFRLDGVGIGAAARAARTSRAAFLLATLVDFLRGHAGGEAIDVLALVANRPSPAAASIVGLFVNSVIVRVDVSGDPGFDELVRRSHRALLDAQANQDIPFSRVARMLAEERATDLRSLARVLFNYEGDAGAGLKLPGIDVEEVDTSAAGAHRVPPTTFDLIWTVRESEGELAGTLDYNRGVFDERTVVPVAEGLAANLRRRAAGQ